MPTLAAVRAANAARSFPLPPIALFVGGTSGIGLAMASALSRYTAGQAHIVIIGRNSAAALQALPTAEFVQCDATLMKNVREATNSVLERFPKINYLVLSPGYMTFSGRDETEEGLDKKLALHYYARWTFTKELTPALQRAKDAGEPAKVFSVLGAGFGGEVDLDDLGLKKNYTLSRAALQVPTYNDLMMEEFATRNPDLTFIHAGPGFVRTNLLSSSQSPLLRYSAPILKFLTYPLSVSQDECAEHMWYGLFNSDKGAFRIGANGEDIGQKRYFGSAESRQKLWEHTVEATKVS